MRSPSAISPTGCAAGSRSSSLGHDTNACSRGRSATSCSSTSLRAATMWANPTAGSGAKLEAPCASSNRWSGRCPMGSLPRRSWSGCAADKWAARPIFKLTFFDYIRPRTRRRRRRDLGHRQGIMGLPGMSRAGVAAAVAGISLALLLPAQAQFWDWGGRPQRPQQYNNNWNNNWGGGGGGWNERRYDPYRQGSEAPGGYLR